MEDRDGRIAARRCLQAMSETQDIETRRSLWRAAGRFMRKGGERREGLENPYTPLPLTAGGVGSE